MPATPAFDAEVGASPYPSPPECSTEGNFLPDIFWKPFSLGAVLDVVAVCEDAGRRRPIKPAAAAMGAVLRVLERCVMAPPPRAALPAPAD